MCFGWITCVVHAEHNVSTMGIRKGACRLNAFHAEGLLQLKCLHFMLFDDNIQFLLRHGHTSLRPSEQMMRAESDEDAPSSSVGMAQSSPFA